MSDRIRISRRQVMQLGIAAPLIAMEARGASDEEVEGAAVKLARVPFPPGKLKKFKDDAEDYCNDNNCGNDFDKTNYGKIIGVLWAYFTDAVIRAGSTIPAGETDLSALLDAAYQARSANGTSGELIARRSKDWRDVYENVTNYCAYRCGLHAARIAGPGNPIRPSDYQVAFGQTSAEIQNLTLKIVRDGKEVVIKGGGC